ncbi:unnamed protein product [Trichogramma brassicae]|uniref:Uncharacterized protein n=1 Tax=Trichogramma brassicae TaxID=86971 RepID=A0A6H5HVY7_9HYME|nr:unnamed protein product [Trichogramma brassicae]
MESGEQQTKGNQDDIRESPKKVPFKDNPEENEIEKETDDPYWAEMRGIFLRTEQLLQQQLKTAAENQKLLQEILRAQLQLQAGQEATRVAQEKAQRDQAEATKKLKNISCVICSILDLDNQPIPTISDFVLYLSKIFFDQLVKSVLYAMDEGDEIYDNDFKKVDHGVRKLKKFIESINWEMEETRRRLKRKIA